MLESVTAKLDVSALYTRLVAFIPDLVTAFVILVAFYVLYRITGASARAILRRAGFHPTLIHLLVNNIYRFILVTFALIMAADQVGVNVGAALAGLGVVGIAVGFAAQDSLANVIAGFVIFWDKPFQVGDWVHVADRQGQVQEITMRTTRIRTRNNTWVVIPNKKVIDEVLVNHSKHGETRVDVPVGIAYKESIEEARSVILAALHGIDGVLQRPAPDVVATALGNSSVDLDVRVWISDATEEQPITYAVIEAAKKALDAAGIEIPFPHLQLFVDEVEDAVWEKADRFRRGLLGES